MKEQAARGTWAARAGYGASHSAHRMTFALGPMAHAELERAADHRDVESYLYVLAGRYATE